MNKKLADIIDSYINNLIRDTQCGYRNVSIIEVIRVLRELEKINREV